MEKALQELAANNNIFVGTVDYGDMLFFPKEIEEEPANRIPVEGFDKTQYPDCMYSKVMSYCEKNGLNPSEVNVYLAPFMSIAGDHAHNDLWGLEAMAEDDDVSNVEINTNEYSWRERFGEIRIQSGQNIRKPPDRSSRS